MWKKTISEKSFACGIVSIFFQFFCRKMLIKFSYIGTAVAIILFYNHESQEFFIWIQVYALRRAFVNWRILDLTKFNLRPKFGSCKMRHYRLAFFWFWRGVFSYICKYHITSLLHDGYCEQFHYFILVWNPPSHERTLTYITAILRSIAVRIIAVAYFCFCRIIYIQFNFVYILDCGNSAICLAAHF